MKRKPIRQGDVILVPCEKVTHGELLAEPVLAYGEVTGHMHKITEGEVRVSKSTGDELLLEVLGKKALLQHGTPDQMRRQKMEEAFDYIKEDCHEPQVLEGFYKILIQKSYEPRGWMPVSD